MNHPSPKIILYLKTFCGWSEGVRAVMRKYKLAHEEKDIIRNPAFRWELEQRSGQSLTPCVEIDGQMLVDVSGAEVEKWLLEHGYIEHNPAEADAPTDSPCTPDAHAARLPGHLPAVGKPRFLG